jgi:hypothetical protein
MKADRVGSVDVLRFTWREKWNLLRFLKWVGDLKKQAAAGRD